MSDEPKKLRRRWLSRTIVYVLIVLASYFAVHRATYGRREGRNDLGRPNGRIHMEHLLGDTPVPRWVESFFRPASWFDDWIGHSPDGPDRPHQY
jgi:hypothetical protein